MVRDNGQGVPPDQRDLMRRRFQSLSDAPGTGLGVSIVEAVAEAHGGQLILSSHGVGLTAEILLPNLP